MATTPDSRSTSAPGESRTAHFANGVHNGMHGHRELGRFGNDDVDPFGGSDAAIASRVSARLAKGSWASGGDDREYDPGAWEGTSMHDRLMGEDD